MINIGKLNTLSVSNSIDSGFELVCDQSNTCVFLPSSMSLSAHKVGEHVDVFVYTDNDGEYLASEELPEAQVGEYAHLRVVEVPEFGAFFDWGIDKDLLVPGNEQKIKVKVGDYHIVRICLEEGTNRVYGTTKLGQFVEEDSKGYRENQKVSLTPVAETDLGYKVIIDKNALGMIYHNQIFQTIRIGSVYEGIVKKVRDDGRIDTSLQAQGMKNLTSAQITILEMLAKNDGKSPLHDKSSPDDIRNTLGMSKKTFKNAVGMLYKERKISITDEGITLL